MTLQYCDHAAIAPAARAIESSFPSRREPKAVAPPPGYAFVARHENLGSRLRGNDGGSCGNDGGICVNDGGVRVSDVGMRSWMPLAGAVCA
jgi:hypothetical protein